MSFCLRRWLPIALLWIALGASRVQAEEDDPDDLSEAEVAARVVEAHGASDTKALDALAQRSFPDPWMTCRILLIERRYDAARAFADRVPEGPRGGLSAEVDAWRAEPESTEVLQSLDEATRLQRAGERAKALELLEAVKPERALTQVIVAIRRASLRTWLEDETAGLVDAFAASHERAKAARWPDMRTRSAHWAGVYARNGRDWEQAASWLEAALASARGSSRPDVLQQVLRDLALARIELSQHEAARRRLEEAVEVAKAAGLVNQTAHNLYRLGDVNVDLGRFEVAIANLQASSEMYASIGRVDGVVGAQVSLGRAYRDAARLAEAEAPLRRAVALAGEHELAQEEGIARRMLGSVALERGELGAARALFDRALELARIAKDATDEAAALHARGEVLYLLRNYEDALTSLQSALRMKMELKRGLDAARTWNLIVGTQRALGDTDGAWTTIGIAIQFARDAGDAVGERQLLALRAQLHAERGDPDAATRDFTRMLALTRAAGDVRLEGWAHAGLGKTALIAGRPDDAAPHLAAARAVFERTGHRLGLIHVAYFEARVRLEQGDARGALAAVDEVHTELRRVHAGLDDANAINVRETYALLTPCGLEAARRLKNVPAAFRVLEGGRAAILLQALGGRRTVLEQVMPADLRSLEIRARSAELRAVQELGIALARGDAEGAQVARERAAAARVELDAAIARMRRDAPQAADVTYSEPIDLETFAKSLAANEAYVAFEFVGNVGYALRVTRKSAELVALPDIGPAQKRLARLRFDAPGLLDEEGIEIVRAGLLEPLGLPAAVTRVLVSPSAELATVPLAVLWPDKDVVHVPSATTYALLAKNGARAGSGVLAAGDPAHPEGATLGGVELVPLPHARTEAKAVGDVVLTGAEATRPAFLAAIRRRPTWAAIHLACHAVIDGERPRRSALALAPTAKSDGRLTVDDVFQLRFPADLVVLSACESGLGKARAGEGLVGFTRAFLFGGARRVIVSLWMVDDEATSALMRRFYEIWQTPRDGKPVPTATALREAQAWIRGQEKWKHPYYWAGFALWGLAD